MKTEQKNNAWQYALLALAILGGLAGVYLLNLHFAIPYQQLHSFILNWNSLQRFIYDGSSPYSAEVYADTTRIVISRGTFAGELEPLHLPLSHLLLFLPFAWMQEIGMAAATWLAVVQFGLAGSVLLVMSRLEGRMSRWYYLPVLLFFLAWQPLYAAINSGSELLVQLGLILLALKMLEQQSDEYAGLLLAFAFFNLEVFGIFYLTLLIWLAAKGRWGVLGGFGLTLALLLLLAFVFQADWVLRYLKNQLEFWNSNDMVTSTLIFEGWLPAAGPTLARIVAVIALALLLFEWQNIGLREAENLLWLAGLALAVVPLLGISYRPEWSLAAMPGLMLVFNRFTARWRLTGFILTLLVMALLGWGLWAAAIAGNAAVHILFFPMLNVALLYWVRWDVLKKNRLWADELARRY